MDEKQYLILTKSRNRNYWKDETAQVYDIQTDGNRTKIWYGDPAERKPYLFRKENVQYYEAVSNQASDQVRLTVNGRTYKNFEFESVVDFGPYIRVFFRKSAKCFPKNEVMIYRNALSDANAKNIFDYLKDVVSKIPPESNKDDEEPYNFLEHQYEKIKFISEETVLACYLDKEKKLKEYREPECIIYPFGMNRSQMEAVKNALTHQISVIQGPPGTGKTQTILNIIANVILNGKTAAVVSNNNSATENVQEKLEKDGVSFVSAFLGNNDNRERFITEQTGSYPDMTGWNLQQTEKELFRKEVSTLSEELYSMLLSKNRIAEINRALTEQQPEQNRFFEYYKQQPSYGSNFKTKRMSSDQVRNLKEEIEQQLRKKGRIGPLKRLYICCRLHFSGAVWKMLSEDPDSVVLFLEGRYYELREGELRKESEKLEEELKGVDFEGKAAALYEMSMRIFKSELYDRYALQKKRKCFEKKDLSEDAPGFIKEYPVILSTTHSIRNSLSSDYIYDYLIMDEASQVDIVTGALSVSCAKNIVIVGDRQQLPNVINGETRKIEKALWDEYREKEISIPEAYCYHKEKQSFLQSVLDVWITGDVPVTMLREHYRCHPKIINFCNKKFYNEDLIIMTSDNGEEDVLSVYETDPYRYGREHKNQRQIEIIKEEVLKDVKTAGISDSNIGIIAPYNNQIDALKKSIRQDDPVVGYKGAHDIEIDTVHKFQGREKEAIILSTTDDKITKFVDDPNMLNVAVSRAVKSLSVILSSTPENDKTLYGDLVRYIRYYNGNIVKSRINSVFDLLYGENEQILETYFKNHKKRSLDYDSPAERLYDDIVYEILSSEKFCGIKREPHYPVRRLIGEDVDLLDAEEKAYAMNVKTHVDFLFYRNIDKSPVLAVEIDGTSNHQKGTVQWERDEKKNRIFNKIGIPLLRLRTDESRERERTEYALQKAIGIRE